MHGQPTAKADGPLGLLATSWVHLASSLAPAQTLLTSVLLTSLTRTSLGRTSLTTSVTMRPSISTWAIMGVAKPSASVSTRVTRLLGKEIPHAQGQSCAHGRETC